MRARACVHPSHSNPLPCVRQPACARVWSAVVYHSACVVGGRCSAGRGSPRAALWEGGAAHPVQPVVRTCVRARACPCFTGASRARSPACAASQPRHRPNYIPRHLVRSDPISSCLRFDAIAPAIAIRLAGWPVMSAIIFVWGMRTATFKMTQDMAEFYVADYRPEYVTAASRCMVFDVNALMVSWMMFRWRRAALGLCTPAACGRISRACPVCKRRCRMHAHSSTASVWSPVCVP